MNAIPVHILITIPSPEAIKSSLLVFKTIRTGFPKNSIFVYGNGLEPEMCDLFEDAARSVGATFTPIRPTTHGIWIEELVLNSPGPFWICDGDIVFFEKVSNWFNEFALASFAGRFEPTFQDPWSGTEHIERLHPSLMWFNPWKLRAVILRWAQRHEFFQHVEYNLFRWHFVPRIGQCNLFYDTCAGLWHALGDKSGRAFTDDQNACFEHLINGTYLNQAGAAYGESKQALHDAVFETPSIARGLQFAQAEWYEKHAPGNPPCEDSCVPELKMGQEPSCPATDQQPLPLEP
jgi:hypothetical protein